LPTGDELFFRRAFAVRRAVKPDGIFIPGDAGNYDAAGKFAETDRGRPPKLQEEINTLRDCYKILDGLYGGEVHTLLTNHEARLIHGLLKGHLDGDDFFTHMLESGQFYDSRIMDIGDFRFMHQHGRKIDSSAPCEFAMRYKRPVYIAGPHRFNDGYAHSGDPCGMLGCMCNIKALAYHANEPNYMEWTNAFALYEPPGRLTFFRDPHTDWSRYGCK
jgi:hypothetical protein